MRPALKTALKISLLLPLGLLGLAVAMYLVLLLINRHDQPPSQAYTALIQVSEGRPFPPEHDNGFIFASGFHAPQNADPEQYGKSFIERQKVIARKEEFAPNYEESKFSDAFSKLPGDLRVAISACSNPEDECLQHMFGGRKSFKPYMTENAWMLDRYSRLIGHPQWRETYLSPLWNQIPHYENLLEAQRLFLIKTWIAAYEGDGKSVSEAIANDHRFWRMVFSSTDSLVARMIAVRALRRNYQMGNLCFQSLPPGSRLEIPEEWRTAYSAEELSMRNVMSGEMLFSREMANAIWDIKRISGDDEPHGFDHVIGKIQDWLYKPLALSQDSLNIQTDNYEESLAAFSVPLDQYGKALNEALARQKAQKSAHARFSLYNPVGRWFITQNGVGLYEDYFLRSADIEGCRRLAVLMTDLRTKKVANAELKDAVSSSEIRDPYTGRAFTVEPGNDYVVFTGHEADKAKARNAFFYR